MLKTNNLKDFITYLQQQVDNHSIYVWGAQGQTTPEISEAWIRGRETSEANANRAIAFWKKQVEAGFGSVLRAFDCSGLGMFWLQNISGMLKYDLSAHGQYNKCMKITKDKLRVGDFVFKVSNAGRATHVGYVVDTELNVIEAKGRDVGVIKRSLDADSWNAFGRPPFWTEAEVAECEGRFIFTRVLKYGRIGDDVCELKKLLAANGFTGLNPKNKNYFGSTRSKVKAFQKATGLTVDGKAGPKTIAALGGFYSAE